MSTQSAVTVRNVPAASLCGINFWSFTTDKNFIGLSDLPVGLHFLFTSSTLSASSRYGVWFRAKSTASSYTLVAKKWDSSQEILIVDEDIVIPQERIARLPQTALEKLTSYASLSLSRKIGNVADWADLTDCITDDLLTRITRGNANHWGLTTASSAPRDVEEIAGLSQLQSVHPETELVFLPVELKITWPPGAVGRQRTEAALDQSWALGQLVENHCTNADEMEVIGELQFTFLMILTLNNFSCLEQWKRIMSVLLKCRSAVFQREKLYEKLLFVLLLQLQHCEDAEDGLFDFTDESSSVLKVLVEQFRIGIDQLTERPSNDVFRRLAKLESYMSNEYGWKFSQGYEGKGFDNLDSEELIDYETYGIPGDNETGEYAPVVVEL